MIDIRNLVQTGLSIARFFFRSPKEVVVENVTASGTALIARILSLPELRAFENDGEAFLRAFGWSVERDPGTGHIAKVQQPAGTWVMTTGGHLEWKPAQ